MLKHLRIVGGVDYANHAVFFSIGDWFQVLFGAPEPHSSYVKLFNQEISQ